MTTEQFSCADGVLFPWKDKRRIGVIIMIVSRRAVICYGSTKIHALPKILIPPDGRYAKALSLSQPTYFYARNVCVVELSALERSGRCPPELFHKLKLLTETTIAQASPLIHEVIPTSAQEPAAGKLHR